MKIHLLSGFLGSGKTTAIHQACDYLVKNDVKTAVITNDQGIRLVDGSFFESINIPNRQVQKGCFCCNYIDLEKEIVSLEAVDGPDVIFAEAVGSCSDMIATVMKPLLKHHHDTSVTFSTLADIRLLKMMLQGEGTTAFSESICYIFSKQLEEAPVIIVTKTDLIDEGSLQETKQLMQEKYEGKILLYQNSFDPESIRKWLEVLDKESSAAAASSLQIDYEIYGEGESKLAWHDQEVEIYSIENEAAQEAISIMKRAYQKIYSNNLPIGHLKFFLNGETKISFTSISGEEPLKGLNMQKGSFATLLVNARVQTDPEILSLLMREVLQETEKEFGCKIIVKGTDSFRPGYPKPVHRLVN